MTTQFEGIKVSYRAEGRGKPLVLLHGYLEAAEVWEPLAERLRGDFRVIEVDQPGHGDSGVRGETHTMEFMAGAVRAVLYDAGEKRVLMIGHSLGGYVALAFAEMFPELLPVMSSSPPILTLTPRRLSRSETVRLQL